MLRCISYCLLAFLTVVSYSVPSAGLGPVNGGWSSWGDWSTCTLTCGGGSQTRQRLCTNPPTRNGGSDCQGMPSESQSCNTNSCPIDGGWSLWNHWSICTKTVSGIQTRTRECANPEPAHGGKKCSGTRAVVRECSNMSSCHEAFPLRFQSAENPSRGIMEIYKNGSWQKLCTRSWDTDEETLTCKAMGYSNVNGYGNGTWYTDSNNASDTIHYNCTTLTECGSTIDRETQLCTVPVRLNGTKVDYGGRVEVFYHGKWGKICRKEWNFEDVKVICRQLGFKRAVAEFVVDDIKDEDIPFIMSDVACNGDEPKLASCPRTDGNLNVDCQNDDTGAQALCEPKRDKKVLDADQVEVSVESTETIECSLDNGTTYIHVRWFNNKHQEVNSTSGTRLKANKGILTIENIQLSDGGTYECRGRAGNAEYIRYYTIYVNVQKSN